MQIFKCEICNKKQNCGFEAYVIHQALHRIEALENELEALKITVKQNEIVQEDLGTTNQLAGGVEIRVQHLEKQVAELNNQEGKTKMYIDALKWVLREDK